MYHEQYRIVLLVHQTRHEAGYQRLFVTVEALMHAGRLRPKAETCIASIRLTLMSSFHVPISFFCYITLAFASLVAFRDDREFYYFSLPTII